MAGPIFSDLVEEYTSNGGTGTLTLAGAISVNRLSVASAMSNGDWGYFYIKGSTAGQWEIAKCTYTSSGNYLTRTSVLKSSNSNLTVDFSGADIVVRLVSPAQWFTDRSVPSQVVSTPSYASSITTDASSGAPLVVRVGALTGNITINNPTGAMNGQRIEYVLKQDGTGSRTLTLDTKFRLPPGLTASNLLNSAANSVSIFCVVYNSSDDKFDLTAMTNLGSAATHAASDFYQYGTLFDLNGQAMDLGGGDVSMNGGVGSGGGTFFVDGGTLVDAVLSDPIVNGAVNFTGGYTIQVDSTTTIDLASKYLHDDAGVASVAWDLRRLIASGGAIAADWEVRNLYDSGDVLSADWEGRTLHDIMGQGTIGWDACILGDSSGFNSVWWSARHLTGTDGTTVQIDWSGSNVLVGGNTITTGSGTLTLSTFTLTATASGNVLVSGGALGTPSGGTLTNCTGLPLAAGITIDAPVDISGTTGTIDSNHSKKVVTTSNGSAVSITLAKAAPQGTVVTLIQKGAGQVTFAAESGATLYNRAGHTKTAGQRAMVSLYVESNAGNAALWYLGGDTAS